MKQAPPVHPFRFHVLSAATLALLSCAASAVDTGIYIDFNRTGGSSGTYAGTAVAPTTGTQWNGVAVAGGASFTSGALFSSTGLATPVTVSLGTYNAFDSGSSPTVARALMSDFVYQTVVGTGGPDSTFALRNLDIAATYDIYFYAQNGITGSTATRFTINGINQTATNAGNAAAFVLNTNYVLYSGLTPSAIGEIAGTFNCAKVADNAAFNGLQIVQHGGTPPVQPPNASRTIKVDFNSTDGTLGTYSGNAVAPNAGSLWNGVGIGPEAGGPVVANFTSPTLSSSDGASTAVTFSLGNFKVYEANENPAALATGLMTDFAYQSVLGNTGPNSTFALAHLDPSSTYDLYLYGQNGGYASTQTTWTINGTTKVAADAGNTVVTFVEGTNYVLFKGLSPDALGNISGTFNCAKPGDNAAFTGFELVQVPEPASMSLLAMGGAWMLGRRRRSA